MRYGYFDDRSREYVIENPNTPMSWVNYLGTSEYCGIISNNASGYGFYKSAKSSRLLRFRFNSIPMDRPGRYVYIRDNDDGDYWSASWQPVGKPLESYKTNCSHGLGYTRFDSKETGDTAFLDMVVPYCDKDEDTVYAHLRKALEFSWSKRGPHGLLLGLAADWNDCINLRGKGESIWSTFLFFRGLDEFITLALRLGRKAEADHFGGYKAEMVRILERYAWDGKWFLRGYLDSGKKLGGQESEQCKIFINSQTWSVVSGAADRDKCMQAMDSL